MTGLLLTLLLSPAVALELDAIPEPASLTEAERAQRAEQTQLKRALRARRCWVADWMLADRLDRPPTPKQAQQVSQCYAQSGLDAHAALWAGIAADAELDPHLARKHRANQLLHTWRADEPMEAARIARHIERQDPLHPRYLLVRARIALEDGRPHDAQDWLRCLTRRQRRDWSVRLLQAEIALAQDDRLAMERNAQAVLNRHPRHPTARALLAEGMRRNGDPHAARTALGVRPRHPWPLWDEVDFRVRLDLHNTPSTKK